MVLFEQKGGVENVLKLTGDSHTTVNVLKTIHLYTVNG